MFPAKPPFFRLKIWDGNENANTLFATTTVSYVSVETPFFRFKIWDGNENANTLFATTTVSLCFRRNPPSFVSRFGMEMRMQIHCLRQLQSRIFPSKLPSFVSRFGMGMRMQIHCL